MFVYVAQRPTNEVASNAPVSRTTSAPVLHVPVVPIQLEPKFDHRLSRISTLPRELVAIDPAVDLFAVRSAQPGAATLQRVSWGTIGAVGGATLGLLGASLLTGGLGPLAAAGAYGVGAIGGAIMGGIALGGSSSSPAAVGHAPGLNVGGPALAPVLAPVLAHADLRSMAALANFRSTYGGDSQGTLAFIHAGDGNYYMIEQETTTKIFTAATARGITYIPQGRRTAYHAEVRFIDWANARGILGGSTVWVSKPICLDCAEALGRHGASLQTSVGGVRYHDWVPPGGENRQPKSTGVFKGHRSETERLEDAAKSWY